MLIFIYYTAVFVLLLYFLVCCLFSIIVSYLGTRTNTLLTNLSFVSLFLQNRLNFFQRVKREDEGAFPICVLNCRMLLLYCTVYFHSTRFCNILYTMYIPYSNYLTHFDRNVYVFVVLLFVFNSLDITIYDRVATKRSLVCLIP